jgi:lipid A 3-O-deacylase
MKTTLALLISVLCSASGTAVAGSVLQHSSLIAFPMPSTIFIQAGAAEDQTHAYLFGAAWAFPWRKQYSIGWIDSYIESSIGRWSTHRAPGGSGWLTQVGLTPVLRFHLLDDYKPWFVEVGVGANVIVPVYRSQEKAFSTKFNFGDHVALGRRVGKSLKQEVAIRLEHFSNAGIDEPNPGENFVQLRYTFPVP